MKRIIIILLLFTSPFPVVLMAQPAGNNVATDLENLFKRLTTVPDDVNRIALNDSITIIVESYVRSDSIFEHSFSDIRYLGQIVSPDGQLKIVTWNLLLSGDASRYFCYFICKSEGENKIYSLTAPYRHESIRTDTLYSEKNWYGALYYDLRPLRKEYKGTWMLLGIDYGNPEITRKIIDVLSLPREGGVVLGKKWFESESEINYRVVLEYSTSAVVTLRFISDKSIVFDHLVPLKPDMVDRREFYGPEYSYDVYNFERGLWRLTLDADIRNKKKK